jgi:hypothetical protein
MQSMLIAPIKMVGADYSKDTVPRDDRRKAFLRPAVHFVMSRAGLGTVPSRGNEESAELG